jgi:hypothetical protein
MEWYEMVATWQWNPWAIYMLGWRVEEVVYAPVPEERRVVLLGKVWVWVGVCVWVGAGA